WIVREVDTLLLLVPFVHGKIDDPAKLEAVLVDQPELLADLRPRGTREPGRRRRLIGGKEQAVAWTDASLGAKHLLNVCRHEFGDRTFALIALPYDISKPRRAHVGARPLDKFVEPRSRLGRRARCGDRADDAASFDHVPERIERNARLAEFLRHVGDRQRIAQIRL